MPDWRDQLVERHPDLFEIVFDGRVHRPGLPAVGDGWRDLVERAVARIAAAAGASASTIKISQIKEKFGTLRLYWSGEVPDAVRDAIGEAIDLAEARSAVTCEACGAPGVPWVGDGWHHTACERHGRGRKVPIRPGNEGLRQVWRADGPPRWVRYDRDADAFVEVEAPPAS
jgi:hypothetical protein